MADDNAASPGRNRLTKERPELGLARDLIKTEYGLREERRGRGENPADTGSLWERLAAELRRLMDRLLGRSRSAPAGGDSSSVGGQEADAFGQAAYAPGRDGQTPTPVPTAVPQGSSASEGPAHTVRGRLEERISRLPTLEHEAFEDAVLHLVRNDEKWKTAFEESPESMPTVARYAANAYMRESLREAPPSVASPRLEPVPSNGDAPRAVTAEEAMNAARDRIMAADAQQAAALRERWERPARSPDSSTNDPVRETGQTPGQQQPVAPSPRTGFQNPREEFGDSNAFQTAERVTLAERARLAGETTSSLSPRESKDFDGNAFLAVHQAAQLENPTAPADRSSPVTPVSPELSPSSPRSPGSPSPSSFNEPSLLSREGRALLRASADSPHRPSSAGSVNSPSAPGNPAPVRTNTTARPRSR